MSIQFDQIHNVVRTYQRVLDLDQAEGAKRARASSDRGESDSASDRVSISQEARQLREASSVKRGGPESDLFKR
jgi:hypothetical protein